MSTIWTTVPSRRVNLRYSYSQQIQHLGRVQNDHPILLLLRTNSQPSSRITSSLDLEFAPFVLVCPAAAAAQFLACPHRPWRHHKTICKLLNYLRWFIAQLEFRCADHTSVAISDLRYVTTGDNQTCCRSRPLPNHLPHQSPHLNTRTAITSTVKHPRKLSIDLRLHVLVLCTSSSSSDPLPYSIQVRSSYTTVASHCVCPIPSVAFSSRPWSAAITPSST